MFTGIVEEVGSVVDVTTTDAGCRLRIEADRVLTDLEPGDSVSVSGACLTVETCDETGFSVFLATETVDRTYLGTLDVGDGVNLERAMPADGRFDGHLVQGHVDTTTTIEAIERVGDDWTYSFSLPASVDRYVVEKGSITLDGISLTVADRGADTFDVAIIPTTYAETTLSEKDPGDPVHVEIDIIAKYVESMLDAE
ncbi:MAG: riboflavin synthase [Halobacteriales archaeon]|nr:riboflavin synthase [Halobacteriales archaeon]